jgi:hypothetical protein
MVSAIANTARRRLRIVKRMTRIMHIYIRIGDCAHMLYNIIADCSRFE